MNALLFPGQGSQKIGMCKELFDKYPIVKNLFNQADDILDIPISKIVFEGPNDLLNLTENTQPAIFLTSYAIYKIALEEFGLNLNDAKFIAGHSLGEYSALASYGAIDFKDCLLTLKKRGKSMQDAIPSGKGSMLAVLGSSLSIIDEILEEIKFSANFLIIIPKITGTATTPDILIAVPVKLIFWDVKSIPSKSAEVKTINGTVMILITLMTAVNDTDKATSPFANLVRTFVVIPPGAAAIIITPRASSIGVFKTLIKTKAIIGSNIS